MSLFTFGAGFAAGYCSGLALFGSGYSQTAIRAIGAVSGAILGAGIKGGTYIIITKVNGKPIDYVSLTLETVSGALTGGFAGYVGANSGMAGKDFSISFEE